MTAVERAPLQGRWRLGAAMLEARFEREYGPLLRRLAGLARFKYRLCREDCEELAADALLAWYQELCRSGVRHDRAYLDRVLHYRALDRKKNLAREKRRAEETLTLTAAVENHGADPQLAARIAEQEELRHLAELAREVLSVGERELVLLSALEVPRVEIAARHGLSVRQLERRLERSQQKLDTAHAAMRRWGRCAMLALVISDIKTGRIGPEHPRYRTGAEHLHACRRCRAGTPIEQANAG